MKDETLEQWARELSRPFRVTHGRRFRLRRHDPADTLFLKSQDKPRAKEALAVGVEALAELQERLFAQDRYALLLIFQGMDAAGKDGAVKHVMRGVDPQGCEVHSFKAPTPEDLDHDYLWRCTKHLPERGRIGIFNRSWYEETLIVRVHRELLDRQKIPPHLVTRNLWNERFEDLRALERHLARNGTVILKFFLHVSKKEQKRRFLERLGDPEKNWKFSLSDVEERRHWRDYQHAYEETIRNTSTKQAPWYVIPADAKWFTRLAVAAAVIDRLLALDLRFPKIDKSRLREISTARRLLH